MERYDRKSDAVKQMPGFYRWLYRIFGRRAGVWIALIGLFWTVMSGAIVILSGAMLRRFGQSVSQMAAASGEADAVNSFMQPFLSFNPTAIFGMIGVIFGLIHIGFGIYLTIKFSRIEPARRD